jgi:hypothetical protein
MAQLAGILTRSELLTVAGQCWTFTKLSPFPLMAESPSEPMCVLDASMFFIKNYAYILMRKFLQD